MVPLRGDLNSQTALRVLALVLMCGHCKGVIQDAPAVPADHCDVGQHGAGAGWLEMASSWPVLDLRGVA